jgi:transcriptional regulator with XRE-family HTH domain
MEAACIALASRKVLLHAALSRGEIMQTEDTPTLPRTPAPELARLARRVKRFRQARRLSLRQLGELTGTSASFLSQLERGLTGATAATLMQIAHALSISVADLFEERGTSTHRVLRRGNRPALPEAAGYRKTLLSQRPIHDFEVYVGEFDVGGSTGDEAYTHGDSHEMMLVLRGAVEIMLGSERFRLEEGDSIEYASSTPHRIVNIGNGRAEVQWIIAPPTSALSDLEMFTGGPHSQEQD